MVRTPQLRQRVEYKKPGKINAVSITMTMMLGIIVYVAYCVAPSFYLRSEVSTLLSNEIVTWFNANLRPTAERSIRKRKMLDALVLTLRKKGVADPELDVEAYGDKKTVWLEARFKTRVEWLWLNKHWDWKHAPRIETSAERVDW